MNTPTDWTKEHFIGGDLALDLANTVYRRTPRLGADLLGATEDLASWLHHAGLAPPDGRDRFDVSPGALRSARAVRAHLWPLLEAQTEGRELPSDALDHLLGAARRGIHEIVVGPDGSTAPRTTRAALGMLALSGLRLALARPAHPLRSCDRCGWFFLDSSRSRRRRWCSMKTCGNQEKAARFRSAHA
jgi:predicted RNA-binding Zn ribbon-like protein